MLKAKNLLAAAVTCGGLTVGGFAFAEDPARSAGADASKQAQAAGQAGDKAEAVASARQSDENLPEVRKVLSGVAEAALSDNGLQRLMEMLATPDRQRLSNAGQGGDDATSTFQDRVKQFRQDWKQKYGKDFDIEKEEIVFSGVRVDTTIREATAGAGADVDGDADAETAGSRLDRKAGGAGDRKTDQPSQQGTNSDAAPGATERGAVRNAPGRDAATFDSRVRGANQDEARAASADEANRVSRDAAQAAGDRAGARARAGTSPAPAGQEKPAAREGQAEEAVTGQVQVGRDAKQGAIPSEQSIRTPGDTAAAGSRGNQPAAAQDAARARAHEADRSGTLNREAAEGDRDQHAAHGQAGNQKLTVIVPPPRGAQDVHVRLVNEQNQGWRIDLPDTMNRQQLLDSLARHMEMVQRDKDTWPDNATDAQRLVSQQMLMAFADTGRATESGTRSTTR